MKAVDKYIGRLIVGCSLACCAVSNSNAQMPPPGPGGGTIDTNVVPYVPPPDIPNYSKYIGQFFSIIDTNDAAVNNTNVYNTLLGFADDNGTNPSVQILPYQNNCLLLKASHFDYSAESSRDFALIINDKVETPMYKTVDLTSTRTNNGWLIQGLIPRRSVSDPMYLVVSNISRVYNAFFKVVPYGGPVVQIAGVNEGDTVSGVLPLTVSITDLSGVTNHQIGVYVNGLPANYTITSSNAISIDTKYAQNGTEVISVKALNQDSRILDLASGFTDINLNYETSASLSLVFENPLFVVNSGDMASLDIGTVYATYGTTQAVSVVASITEPSSGRLLAHYSGVINSAGSFALPWGFTEANGSAYTNTSYVVALTATPTTTSAIKPKDASGGFTLTLTNMIDVHGVRNAAGCIIHNEANGSSGNGNYLDQQEAMWGQSTAQLYESLYDKHWDSLTLYTTGDIGDNRENSSSAGMPYTVTSGNQTSWPDWLHTTITNKNYSDFNYGPGHANGFMIGGGPMIFGWMNYVSTTITSQSAESWAMQYGNNWRMRKVAMWGCYTARHGTYSSWYEALGIRDTTKQLSSFMYKNAGLFFNEELTSNPYGDPVTTIYEVTDFFDYIWIAGPNGFPGACDPTYSFQKALMITEGTFPELVDAEPVGIGYPYLPYTGIHDFNLLMLDSSSVHK